MLTSLSTIFYINLRNATSVDEFNLVKLPIRREGMKYDPYPCPMFLVGRSQAIKEENEDKAYKTTPKKVVHTTCNKTGIISQRIVYQIYIILSVLPFRFYTLYNVL